MTDAMTGLATGLKQNRKQDILTPQVVVDFLHALWGPVVGLDPCATHDPRDVVNAERRIHEPENENGNGGLDVAWCDRTYANPPYGDLHEWLLKANGEALNGNRTVVLAPTRGNRTWWHEVRDTCSIAVELGPLCFVGYEKGSLIEGGKNAGQRRKSDEHFPSPLSLLCWNVSYAEVLCALHESGLRYTKISICG